jgi:hypothetical protein
MNFPLDTSFNSPLDLGLNIPRINTTFKQDPFSLPSSSQVSSMAFPFLAAATVAAPLIGGLFGNRAAAEQREGSKESIGLQTAFGREQALLGGAFQELARDNEAARQLRRGIDRFNLLGSGPAVAFDTRAQGFELAGKGYSPTQIAQFTDMFGGYS